jgi:hypothetical protein
MRLTDHVTLNFDNKMSTAAVFLDIEKAFDTTWHPGLIYKLSKLEFSTRLSKFINSILSQRKFRVAVEGEISPAREMKAGVPQGSILSPTLYNLYINDTSQTIDVNLALFVLTTPVFMRHNARRATFSENSNAAWTQWRPDVSVGTLKSMKIRLAIYFSHRIRPPESLLTLNGWNIPFVSSVKYLGVLFNKNITWRPHIEMEPRPSKPLLEYISYSKLSD